MVTCGFGKETRVYDCTTLADVTAESPLRYNGKVSDIRCFENSPDGRYQAVGGSRAVYVFNREQNLCAKLALSDSVFQLVFIKLHNDYVLACRDLYGKVKVYGLKERVLLYSADDIDAETMSYSEEDQSLYVQTREGNIV